MPPASTFSKKKGVGGTEKASEGTFWYFMILLWNFSNFIKFTNLHYQYLDIYLEIIFMPRNNLFLNGRVNHTCRLALVTIKITFCSPLFTLLSNTGTHITFCVINWKVFWLISCWIIAVFSLPTQTANRPTPSLQVPDTTGRNIQVVCRFKKKTIRTCV